MYGLLNSGSQSKSRFEQKENCHIVLRMFNVLVIYIYIYVYLIGYLFYNVFTPVKLFLYGL